MLVTQKHPNTQGNDGWFKKAENILKRCTKNSVTGNIIITLQIYIFRRLKNDLANLKNNLYKNIVF